MDSVSVESMQTMIVYKSLRTAFKIRIIVHILIGFFYKN